MFYKPPPLGHVDPKARALVWRATDFVTDREHFADATVPIPARLHEQIARIYVKRHAAEGNYAANMALSGVRDLFKLPGVSMDLAASDFEIREAAKDNASRCSRMMFRGVSNGPLLRQQIDEYCAEHGVRPPEGAPLAGYIARVSDASWWRRALRRSIVRKAEEICIRIGLVHRRASIYASAEAVARRTEQRHRNMTMLQATIAENEEGEQFTLADLSARSVSNPAVRRAELMTRIRGFEEFATAAGHAAQFITATCPSRMHARFAMSGEENPKYDGTTPRDAQRYLVATWAKARAKLARKGVNVYGFRIAEPHHDGTPHWHLLLFMPHAHVAWALDVMREYFTAEDGGELGTDRAREARFKAIPIEAEQGTAAGYVAKYVAKNIDGFEVGEDEEAAAGTSASETVRAVDAWAATWGIRQFQQIGGPGVTIWRELRRLREKPQRELFADFWEAADAGDWRAYVRAMGGVDVKRRERPLQLLKVERMTALDGPDRDGDVIFRPRLNRYGEAASDQVQGVQFEGVPLITRLHSWTVKGAKHAGPAGHRGRVGACAREVDGGEAGAGHHVAHVGMGRGIDAAVRAPVGAGEGNGPRDGAGGVRGDRGGVPSLADVAVFWKQLERDDPEHAHPMWARAPVGFRGPWTRVNNCTGRGPLEGAEDGVGSAASDQEGGGGGADGAAVPENGAGGSARGPDPGMGR